MEAAALTIAYLEERYIGACIKQFEDVVDTHLVLVSIKPWHGEPKTDRTAEIAREAGATVIEGFWNTEEEQRNYGIALLREFERVLVVDPDEFYEDPTKLLEESNMPCGVCEIMTYWKTTDFVFDPPDRHRPVVWVDPKRVQFSVKRDVRQFKDRVPEFNRKRTDTCLHHMSWVKTDEEVLNKINSYSHVADIDKRWYNKVWLSWTEGSDMVIKPYGTEQSIAKRSPAPEKIINLL